MGFLESKIPMEKSQIPIPLISLQGTESQCVRLTKRKEEKMQNHTKKSSWGFSKSPNPHGEISYPHPAISV